MSSMRIEPVAIIGAGPAGLATALQLKRYRIEARLFEESQPGGLLRNANWVENYPGFPDGTSGMVLSDLILQHAREWGVEITAQRVCNLDWRNDTFLIETNAAAYRARAVVIASGTKPRLLTDFTLPSNLSDRLYYQITPLLGLRDKGFVIVGAGDAAFDYALNLGKQNRVIILNRSERVNCLPLLWERAATCTNITYHPSVNITATTAHSAGGLIVECSSPTGSMDFQADYIIGAIGRIPQLDFVSASLLERASEFEKQGILHFVGDVKNGIFRQTAIAVGDGIRAAMCLHQVLKETADESDCFDRKRRYRHRLHR